MSSNAWTTRPPEYVWEQVLVFGSGTVWNDLLTAGLVGEVHLPVGPKLLGDGVPLFTGAPTSLRLLEVRPIEGSSLLVHRYDATPAQAG